MKCRAATTTGTPASAGVTAVLQCEHVQGERTLVMPTQSSKNSSSRKIHPFASCASEFDVKDGMPPAEHRESKKDSLKYMNIAAHKSNDDSGQPASPCVRACATDQSEDSSSAPSTWPQRTCHCSSILKEQVCSRLQCEQKGATLTSNINVLRARARARHEPVQPSKFKNSMCAPTP